MFNFEVKDIVRFVDETKVRPDYLHNFVNIYQIHRIDGEKITLQRDYAEDIIVNRCDITGVPMDGKDDRFIYFDPIIMASIVMPGDPVPVHNRDYTYYLDANVTFPHNKTMRDFIEENGFKYVHELQHYLREHYQTDDLKINI